MAHRQWRQTMSDESMNFFRCSESFGAFAEMSECSLTPSARCWIDAPPASMLRGDGKSVAAPVLAAPAGT